MRSLENVCFLANKLIDAKKWLRRQERNARREPMKLDDLTYYAEHKGFILGLLIAIKNASEEAKHEMVMDKDFIKDQEQKVIKKITKNEI